MTSTTDPYDKHGRRAHTGQHKRLRTWLRSQRDPCHLCGGEIDYAAHYLDPHAFTMDHLVPVARGGLNERDNVAAAHRRCNRAKSDGGQWSGKRRARTAATAAAAADSAEADTEAPDVCTRCNKVHGPHPPGVTYITCRTW